LHKLLNGSASQYLKY